MHPRFQAYINEVRSILGENPEGSELVARVQIAAKDLVATPFDIDPELRRVSEGSYGRNLIYRDPDFGFVVIAMAWPPGIQGGPHDHGTWGVIAVAEGEVILVNYEREDDGKNPSVVKLSPRDRVEGHVGDVGYVLPPEVDFHTVGNACKEQFSLTIHTYGRDITECNLACPESGQLTRVFPTYN